MSTPVALIRQIAEAEFGQIVVGVEVVAWSQNRARLVRIRIIDGSYLDIRMTGQGDYSYHWEHRMTDGGIHRWDNAPHHQHVSTHPHHLHDGTEAAIVASNLPSTSTDDDIRHVLTTISQILPPDAYSS